MKTMVSCALERHLSLSLPSCSPLPWRCCRLPRAPRHRHRRRIRSPIPTRRTVPSATAPPWKARRRACRWPGAPLRHGDSVDAIAKSIASGFPQGRMPAFLRDDGRGADLPVWPPSSPRSAPTIPIADFKIAAPPARSAGRSTARMQSFRVEIRRYRLDSAAVFHRAAARRQHPAEREDRRAAHHLARRQAVRARSAARRRAFNDGFTVPGILLVYGMGYLLDVAPASGLCAQRLDLPFLHRALQRLQRGQPQVEATGFDGACWFAAASATVSGWISRRSGTPTRRTTPAWWTWPRADASPSTARAMCS